MLCRSAFHVTYRILTTKCKQRCRHVRRLLTLAVTVYLLSRTLIFMCDTLRGGDDKVSTVDDLLLTEVTTHSNGAEIKIRHQAALLDRLVLYNHVVSLERAKILRKTMTLGDNSVSPLLWPNVDNTSLIKAFRSNIPDIFARLSALSTSNNDTTVVTVQLLHLGSSVPQESKGTTLKTRLSSFFSSSFGQQTMEDAMYSNYLLSQYYNLHAADALCTLLRQLKSVYVRSTACKPTDVTKMHLTSASVGASVDSISFVAEPGSIERSLFVNQIMGSRTSPVLCHVHIIRHATVTEVGHVFAANFHVVTAACHHQHANSPPAFDEKRLYDEVFVTTQLWGGNYYHKVFENLSRLAPLLPFLRNNPGIRIHIERDVTSSALLRVLNLDADRIVSGVVHAKVVYLPKPTPCGNVRLPELQLLAREFRAFIEQNLTVRNEVISNRQQPDTIVLIKRTKKRPFSQQNDIEAVVEKAAQRHGLRYVLYPDNPVPALHETMMTFYNARVVIGPHGAGLANMIFSRPGTYVIEGTCFYPGIQFTYVFLSGAYHLGHVYYGLTPRGWCNETVNTQSKELEYVLDSLLTKNPN